MPPTFGLTLNMADYYHYTLEVKLPLIQRDGVFPNHPYYTITEYFNAYQAGQALGVMEHNIDCVLKFSDDGFYRKQPDVPSTGRFTGGGNQYQHPFRPKPIAIRKINERIWRTLP